ncbi:apolipoprotein N-acyltransferase [Marinicauda salina]|uniref:Apolipoprotein N-acyltransferase n=1 Tax=Marinicauda salina TaxID=2135793 RepID=A0A2U2BWH6_9PROT|nr:apolipoprotein N-acyltransferase [Marinicauda salina]PWE18324.1 apolipoprotein N-acyltransferase [Marinicauda salina]
MMRAAVRSLRRTRARLRLLREWRAGAALFVLGALSVLAHAPFFLQPALLVALVALVLLLDDARRGPRPIASGFFRGWAFAAGMFLAGTWWVSNAFLVSAADHAWLLWAPLVLMPGGLALFWGAAGAVYVRFSRPGPARIAVFAAAFMTVELLRSWVLSGFPWNLPGHVWPAGGAMSQAAALIGAAGLSAVTLYAFAAPAALFGAGARAARWTPPVAGAVLLAALFGYGGMRLATAPPSAESGEIVRVVQLTVPQREKIYDNRSEILERYLALSAGPGLADVDAVVWPEGAVPAYILREPDIIDRLAEVFPVGARLITGAPRAETEGETTRYFNSLLVIDFTQAGPRLSAHYDKARLVPFGEGNPVRGVTELFGFQSLSTNSPFYTPGPGPRTLDVEGLPPFAPLICYEVIYPRYAPRGAERPEWLLNISNDAWYGNSAGPRQHLNQARYRAIEEGLPMIRAASSGVSGMITPYGREGLLMPLDVDEAFDIRLLEDLNETFYAKYGDLPWAGGAIILLLLVILPPFLVLRGRASYRSTMKPRV